MKNENRTPLTLTEACTLLARETVSLLEGDVIVSPAAAGMRDTLALICGTEDLADGGALLAWVDRELEATRRLAEKGEKTDSLVDLPTPLPLPDPAMQLDAVWAILQATVQRDCAPKQWQSALDAVRCLTEMDSLEDSLLSTFIPDGGFMTAGDLHAQLEQVQAALQAEGMEFAIKEMEVT